MITRAADIDHRHVWSELPSPFGDCPTVGTLPQVYVRHQAAKGLDIVFQSLQRRCASRGNGYVESRLAQGCLDEVLQKDFVLNIQNRCCGLINGHPIYVQN